MSSSKIMGYNLDDSVLNGVAQESTVESVGTKVDEKSTETLTKLDEMGSSSRGGDEGVISVESGTFTATPAIVFSTTGRGRLYFGAFNLLVDANLQVGLTIKIDDVVFLSFIMKNTTTSARYFYVTLYNSKYDVSHTSERATFIADKSLRIITTELYGGSNSTSGHLEPGPDTKTWSFSVNSGAVMYIKDYIQFNSSIEVKITGSINTGNTNAFSIGYELIE